MSGGRDAEAGEDHVVVVPKAPGRLIRPNDSGAGRRHRDDLDALIDELLPDSTRAPARWTPGRRLTTTTLVFRPGEMPRPTALWTVSGITVRAWRLLKWSASIQWARLSRATSWR